MKGSTVRRVTRAHTCPAIRFGIVSPASVQIRKRRRCRRWWRSNVRIVFPACVQVGPLTRASPNDHFTAGPHCTVIAPTSGHVGNTSCCPAVNAGIVPSAGIQRGIMSSAPDDHFTAGPDCRVLSASRGCVDPGGSRPTIRSWVVSPAGVYPANALLMTRTAPDNHFAASPHCGVTRSA